MFAVALAYFGLHAAFGRVLGGNGMGLRAAPSPGLVAWVLGCFGRMFAVQGAGRARPSPNA